MLWFFYYHGHHVVAGGPSYVLMHRWALILKNRLILGTLIAFGVTLVAQVSSVPTIAIEVQTLTPTTIVAYAEENYGAHAALGSQASTEAAVRRYFSDIPIMAEIARCESTFRHINPRTGAVLRGYVNSNDVGVMQINTYYHGTTAARLGLDLMKLEDNMAYARYLYEREGTRPWNASRPCWGKHYLAMR